MSKIKPEIPIGTAMKTIIQIKRKFNVVKKERNELLGKRNMFKTKNQQEIYFGTLSKYNGFLEALNWVRNEK